MKMRSILEWPNDTPPLMLWLALLLGLFITVAVVIEIIRRAADRRKRLRTEWASIQEIAKERQLSDDEWRFLRSFIHRHSSHEPLRAVTVRQHFDECVDAEMHVLEHHPNEYEKTAVVLRDIRERLVLDYVPVGQRIHSTRELHSGQSIWLAPDSDMVRNWTHGNVVSVDEGHFVVTLQSAAKNSFNPAPGELVRCRLWREEDARYVFSTRLDRVEREPWLWILHHTSALERMQSRAFYRVRHDQSTSVGILDAPLDENVEDVSGRHIVTKFRGRLTSLSAGGFALVVPQAIPKQVLLRVVLEIPDVQPLEVDARVIAASPISGGRYLVRGAYLGVSEEVRDIIARYVLRRQQMHTGIDA